MTLIEALTSFWAYWRLIRPKSYFFTWRLPRVLSRRGLKIELDRGSIGSNPRHSLIIPYRLTNSARLFYIVLFNMGDLHLVLTALNLSTLNAGILIMIEHVRLMMFSLNMVDHFMFFLLLSTWICCAEQVVWVILSHAYSLILSSPGPKPLNPKPKNQKNQGALGWH